MLVLLQQLTAAETASPAEVQAFDQQVAALHDRVRRHRGDEEASLFPAAGGLVQDLRALGTQSEAVSASRQETTGCGIAQDMGRR